ncbi:MAG TPA: adenylate/guanylate cyclase domain-containing protein, partial [Candidatus Saccharimonadales bacterium]|nr:adenylate/guanylate cyclase domain-containing protein [Candidatus Saccharimonadales bacterium]
NGHVVLGAEVTADPALGSTAKTVTRPFPALREAAAGFGSVELRPSSDLFARQHTVEDPRQDLIPTLSWAAAEATGAPSVQRPETRFADRWINYYGPSGFLPAVSYFQALDPAQVPDSFFDGRTVFVGARLLTQFAGERKDEYLNPFSRWRTGGRPSFIAGVEIQATMYLNLQRGDWLTRLPVNVELALVLCVGVLAGGGLVWLRPTRAAAAATLACVAVPLAAYALFVGHRAWFSWLVLVMEVAVGLGWSVFFNSIQLYVQKRLQQQTLEMYLPPALVKKFAGNPALLKPGAEEQELTILFTDIADFTQISQRLTSHELATLMNRYFETAVAECVHRTNGTVAKYIGDAIFAFWNAPDAQPDHAARACEAAVRFRRLPPLLVGDHPLRTRLGIHTGTARVGNFGSVQRVDYTALGESVNLASRLEGLNKFVGTECLITRATCDQAGERVLTRRVGHFQLKGFEKTVEVFELVGGPEDAEATREWREEFAQALRNFEERNLEFAEAGFRRVLELRPGDGPSVFYLDRLDQLRAQELPQDWATYTIVREK